MTHPTETSHAYWIRPHQWAVGFGVAFLLHAGVAGAVLWQSPPPPGAKAPGIGGIEVSLGPIGGAAGHNVQEDADVSEPPVEEPAPEQVPPPDPISEAETTETPPPVPPVVEDVPDVVEVEEVTETPDVPDIQDVKEEVPEPEPVPEEAIEVLAETPPIVDPTPAFVPPVLPTKKPKEPERVKQKVVEPQTPKAPADPKTLEKRQVAEAPKAPEPVSKTEPTASQPPAPSSARGSQGKSGSQDSRDAGNANAQSAGGNPGSTADYIARLQAWLARHKEYPRSAQKRGQQGTALLFFVIDRQGHVINHNIRKSSGYRVLDKEVSEMIERAQPLPRIPDDLPMQQMQLVLPVQFTIQK